MAVRTPRSVALLSASVITGLLAIAWFLPVYFISSEFHFHWFILFVVLSFLVSYYTVSIFIEKFIYSKVKIIYRTIHRFSSGQTGRQKLSMANDVLGQVNNEVLDWAEQKIREVKSLKETENFRKEFIGNLAHELKTPVFNIQGYIETLLDGELDNEELNRKFLQKASKNVERITNLLKDLDEITRIESGEVPLVMSRFDVAELARKVVDSFELKAKAKLIQLSVKQNPEVPVMVEADADKIEQVFINLIGNSLDYGRENGTTTVSFFDIEENILVEVADNGLGIASEHLPRIFERFYRVDKSRSRNEGGSGLGLAICKHIIESHKQTLTVRSSPGLGSTFGFTLKKAR